MLNQANSPEPVGRNWQENIRKACEIIETGYPYRARQYLDQALEQATEQKRHTAAIEGTILYSKSARKAGLAKSGLEAFERLSTVFEGKGSLMHFLRKDPELQAKFHYEQALASYEVGELREARNHFLENERLSKSAFERLRTPLRRFAIDIIEGKNFEGLEWRLNHAASNPLRFSPEEEHEISTLMLDRVAQFLERTNLKDIDLQPICTRVIKRTEPESELNLRANVLSSRLQERNGNAEAGLTNLKDHYREISAFNAYSSFRALQEVVYCSLRIMQPERGLELLTKVRGLYDREFETRLNILEAELHLHLSPEKAGTLAESALSDKNATPYEKLYARWIRGRVALLQNDIDKIEVIQKYFLHDPVLTNSTQAEFSAKHPQLAKKLSLARSEALLKAGFSIEEVVDFEPDLLEDLSGEEKNLYKLAAMKLISGHISESYPDLNISENVQALLSKACEEGLSAVHILSDEPAANEMQEYFASLRAAL